MDNLEAYRAQQEEISNLRSEVAAYTNEFKYLTKQHERQRDVIRRLQDEKKALMEELHNLLHRAQNIEQQANNDIGSPFISTTGVKTPIDPWPGDVAGQAMKRRARTSELEATNPTPPQVRDPDGDEDKI